MFGDKVFLFPDYGQRYAANLRTNALFANQIGSTSIILPIHWRYEDVCSWLKDKGSSDDSKLIKRALKYAEFTNGLQEDLRLLTDANLLIAPTLDQLGSMGRKALQGQFTPDDSTRQTVAELRAKFENASPPNIALLRNAFCCLGPSFIDVIVPVFLQAEGSVQVAHEIAEGKIPALLALGVLSARDELLNNEEFVGEGVFLFFCILALVVNFAEENGCMLVSTDPQFASAIHAARVIISEELHDVSKRSNAEIALTQEIVHLYVPAIHSLPLPEILNLRVKCDSELSNFRSGVIELAASMDYCQSPTDIQRQADNLVATRINPAVRELKAKLKNARIDALQKIGCSPQSISTMAVSATVNLALGYPIAKSALAGVACGIIGSLLLEGELERQKLRNASQWSVLLEFEDLKSDKN